MPLAEKGRRSAPIRYSIPLVALFLATALTVFVHKYGGPNPPPVTTLAFLLAILASAWWGGYMPGVIASLLAAFVVPFAFVPHFAPGGVDPIRLLLLLILSILISRVAQMRDRAEAALRSSNENLDERVRQRTAELERSNSELTRLNEDLNQFAYSVSHDLQEPLRMMALYSQMLERKYKDRLDADAGEYIGNIVHGAARMDMLLRDLLAYTQAVNVPLSDVEPVEAEAVLAEALSNLRAALTATRGSIRYDRLPRLRVKEVHLMQLFQNIISNAIKYRGSDPPAIDITAMPENGRWMICVKDNGIGIPAESRGEIFRMFRRLHAARDYEGTGMGLAICQRIVQRYGGRIWVESSLGEGSKFCFTLPAAGDLL